MKAVTSRLGVVVGDKALLEEGANGGKNLLAAETAVGIMGEAGRRNGLFLSDMALDDVVHLLDALEILVADIRDATA